MNSVSLVTPSTLRRLAPVLLSAALMCQGCASAPVADAKANADVKLPAAAASSRAAAEKQLADTFALRDRREHPEFDLVSHIGVFEDRLEFRSSADTGVITCIFSHMGKTELVPTWLTHVGEAKLTGCSRDVHVFFWHDNEAKSFAASIDALR